MAVDESYQTNVYRPQGGDSLVIKSGGDLDTTAGSSVDTNDLAASAVTTAKIADDAVTAAKVADACLTGLHVDAFAAGAAIPGILVVHTITIAGGAAGNADITPSYKFRILKVIARHTGGAGEASDTIQITDGTNAITDAMDWSGADNTEVEAATIDDAYATVAALGTIRATTTDNDAGDDVGAGEVILIGVISD